MLPSGCGTVVQPAAFFTRLQAVQMQRALLMLVGPPWAAGVRWSMCLISFSHHMVRQT